MVFSSLHFIIFFLPVVLLLYYIVPKSWRNVVLFLASLYFYGWGEPKYLLLMLAVITIGYLSGRWMAFYPKGSRKRTMVVVTTIVLDLFFLGTFKYADFMISNLNQLFHLNLPLLHIPLPLGISFYIFQTMSYTIDVYREDAGVQKSWLKFGTYVSMFPQLVAGPIVRYNEIEEQLDHRHQIRAEDIHYGLERFILGLGKKVLIANPMGLLNEAIIAESPGISMTTAWLGLLAYTFQIYYDFSGYSDMAIGLGKMLGFTFMENFNYPYISKSITEFWRRWHISLSTWFKEYVYIPLGGNRRNQGRVAFNLLVVWFLTGLWHGAHWNFILWGLYYFVLLMIERYFIKGWLEEKWSFLARLKTFLLVMFGWNLFQFTDFTALIQNTKLLFSIGTSMALDDIGLFYTKEYLALLIIAALGATPVIHGYWQKWRKNKWGLVLGDILLLGLMLLVIANLVKDTYNPFLYFRF